MFFDSLKLIFFLWISCWAELQISSDDALVLVPHGDDPDTSKDRVIIPHGWWPE